MEYQVDGNTGRETAEGTTAYPVLAARSGNNMLKFDPATVNRSISEGDKGRNVGARVTVKAGSNHGAVAYTFVDPTAGDAPKFEIDEDRPNNDRCGPELRHGGCRQLPRRRLCTVMVRATDASGDATATAAEANVFLDATVTIKVTNVDEKPVFRY